MRKTPLYLHGFLLGGVILVLFAVLAYTTLRDAGRDKAALRNLSRHPESNRKRTHHEKPTSDKHGEIKNLEMPGMTIVFQVKDPAMLDKLQPGDKVRFRAEKSGGAFVVTELQAAK